MQSVFFICDSFVSRWIQCNRVLFFTFLNEVSTNNSPTHNQWNVKWTKGKLVVLLSIFYVWCALLLLQEFHSINIQMPSHITRTHKVIVSLVGQCSAAWLHLFFIFRFFFLWFFFVIHSFGRAFFFSFVPFL